MKFNSIQCCYESTFTEELLTECMKATSEAIKIARLIHNHFCLHFDEVILNLIMPYLLVLCHNEVWSGYVACGPNANLKKLAN